MAGYCHSRQGNFWPELMSSMGLAPPFLHKAGLSVSLSQNTELYATKNSRIYVFSSATAKNGHKHINQKGMIKYGAANKTEVHVLIRKELQDRHYFHALPLPIKKTCFWKSVGPYDLCTF